MTLTRHAAVVLCCRDDFDPDTFENKAALGLLQRFVTNGREVDGSPTRDRLKMIVRCAHNSTPAAACSLQ
jgi:hypothetical protein